ncbi:hypothetical protein FOZ62_018873 [Perkinsus olseni]|uniref:Uncharacterized protein n=1 Tax=Perkinsus olseni TaxID=32597 RepID=A0A7J6TCB8_PEROL|nr:hypothetical protein FOZ62_018873 [Perkinsus olseni]
MSTITDVLNIVDKVALAASSRPVAYLLTVAAAVSLFRLVKHRKRKAQSLCATFGGPTRVCLACFIIRSEFSPNGSGTCVFSSATAYSDSFRSQYNIAAPL